MTLTNGFGKCSLFVLSADGWKDRNMYSSFSRQRKPKYGERIVRLVNGVAVWRQSEVSIDFQQVLGRDVFSSERSLNQPKATLVCIRSTNQSNRSIFVRLLSLSCSRVFISRSYENRSNGIHIYPVEIRSFSSLECFGCFNNLSSINRCGSFETRPLNLKLWLSFQTSFLNIWQRIVSSGK